MPMIKCGDRIHLASPPSDPPPLPGTAGCLVYFPDRPSRTLLLTAGHVVVRERPRQYDPIETEDGTLIGRLWSWTSLAGDTTCDAALVWVDPNLVSPEIIGFGVPKGINRTVKPDDELSIFGADGTKRRTRVQRMDDVDVNAIGPDWPNRLTTYHNQILCSPVTDHGDSGSVALDKSGNVVGMVVAGEAGAPYTVLTPIAAILNNRAWGDGRLVVLDKIPATAIAPPPHPIDLRSIPAQRQPMAQHIIDAFSRAGFGLAQQIAALANAMAESNLDPTARSVPPEDSVGLFQLNRNGGRGDGRSVEALQDADTNIGIIITAAKNVKAFTQAATLDDAVAAFVRYVEIPADIPKATVNRQLIARGLLLV